MDLDLTWLLWGLPLAFAAGWLASTAVGAAGARPTLAEASRMVSRQPSQKRKLKSFTRIPSCS